MRLETKCTSPRAAAAALSLLCLLAPLDAYAAPGELFGYDYGATSDIKYYGPGGLFSASYSAASQPGYWHNGNRNGKSSTSVDSHFQVGVTLFNTTKYLTTVYADAERDVDAGDAPDLYAYGQVYVAGKQLFYSIDRDGNGDGTAQASFERRLTQTFFSKSYSTTVGPIPVTVRGSVKGTATGGMMARTVNMPFSSETTNSVTGRAGVHGTFSVTVGVPNVLAAGVQGYCNFIDVAFTPTAFSNSAFENVNNQILVAYRYGHRGPMTISSLDGWLKVFVDVPFYTYDRKLLDWDGVSWTRNLWNDSTVEHYSFNW